MTNALSIDYDRAIADYSEQIKLNPDDVGAYLNRGDALRSKGELASAGEDYGQAIRLAPDNPGGFGGRGQIRLFTHDFSGAVADFDTAIRINPNDVNSHINRGAALSLLGENLRALQDFDKVIALAPNNPLAYVERGQAMQALGDHAGAFAAVNVALKLVPNFPPALDALKTIGTPKNAAQIRAALGRPVAPGECMIPVADIKLDPKSIDRVLQACTGLVNSPGGSADDRSLAFLQRGSMYRRLEKYDQALADFDQALRYDPNSASAIPAVATRYAISAALTSRSRRMARRSGSNLTTPWPTAIAATLLTTRRTISTPSPISMRRSSSTRATRPLSTIAPTPSSMPGISRARSPTTARPWRFAPASGKPPICSRSLARSNRAAALHPGRRSAASSAARRFFR